MLSVLWCRSQRLFAEVLLRPGKDLYLRLPVRYGEAVTRDNVVKTCEVAGFRPICRNRDESWSGDCFKMELGQNKDTNTYNLIREVCQDKVRWDENETPTSLCPKIYGTFFYMHNLTNEDRSLEYTSTGLLMRRPVSPHGGLKDGSPPPTKARVEGASDCPQGAQKGTPAQQFSLQQL